MKPLLLVRNDAFEAFGIAPGVFAIEGVPTQIWEALDGEPAPDLDDVSGVIMLGSSYNVEHAEDQPWIDRAGQLTRDVIAREMPYLGVCFGAQLLAWSLGARVYKSHSREVGFAPVRPLRSAADDPLLSHYEDGDQVFQWHMDTFDLPEGAELLATGDTIVNQAYRVGATTWGVQYHFEIDEPEILLWLDEFQKDGDLLEQWGKTKEQVLAETRTHLAEHERKGGEVFRRFAALAREASR